MTGWMGNWALLSVATLHCSINWFLILEKFENWALQLPRGFDHFCRAGQGTTPYFPTVLGGAGRPSLLDTASYRKDSCNKYSKFQKASESS